MVKNQKQKQFSIEQINAQYGKLPPQAIDVEEAVIGALMLEREAMHRVSDVVDTHSFYKEEHQKIFEVIKHLHSKQKVVDLLTVTQQLKDQDELDKVGGPGYIVQLTSRVASAAHIEFHARIVAQKFIQRELIRVSTEIQAESYDDTIDMDDQLSSARTKLNDIDNLILCSSSGQTSKVVASKEIIELEKDCKRTKEGLSPGIPTGLTDLNEATGGWRNTDLIIIAARPSVGKSSLAFFFNKIAAESGFWVNHYSFEMKNGKIFRVNLASETGIPRTNIRDGKIEESDWQNINRATGVIGKRSIIWDDNSNLNVNHIRANTIRNVRAGRCNLLVIDYLQLIKAADRKQIREQQISDISRTLKDIAMQCNIPVIALSQLNRAVESRAGKEPGLADLRESGAIEQDADVVAFLWDKDDPKFKIEKNRNGKTGLINFWTNKERTVYHNSEPFTSEATQAESQTMPTNNNFSKDIPF